MTDPIRAALERLHQYSYMCPEHDTDEIVAAARAALAEPESLEDRIAKADAAIEANMERIRKIAATPARQLTAERRAALAEPEPVGPTDDEPPPGPLSEHDLRQQWNQQADEFNQWDSLDSSEQLAWAQVRAIAADRARWGRPAPAPAGEGLKPVPVGEGLPQPKDCLDEGWAWFFNSRVGWRQMVMPVSAAYTHWLPAHALPIPQEES